MENYQLYDMNIASGAMAKHGKGKFRIKMLVIEELCSGRIEILDKIKEPSEKYKEFQQKYQELVLPHAEKNEDGSPILYTGINGTGVLAADGKGFPNVVEDVEKFNEGKKALDTEYKHIIEEYENSEKEWWESMTNGIDPEIDFPKVDADDFPDEISDDKYDAYLRVLRPIINY